MKLSGLEPVTIGDGSLFVNVGERTNVTGSKAFARMIIAEQYEQALSVARQQVENGAQIIDVNMDEAMLDGKAAMVRFLRMLGSEPDIAKVPVMVDSSKWEILEAGLQCLQGKGIVNSISMKEGVEEFKRQARLVRRYGAAAVVMAFDEQGQADTLVRRQEICERAYRILVDEVGFAPEDIIFDPNVFPIATGIEEHARNGLDFIEATRWIKQHLPGAKVSGGISNVSFSFRGNDPVREAIHTVFLYHAIQAGLDMGIVNAGMIGVYDDLEPELRTRVEDVVLNRRPDAAERLLEIAESAKGAARDDGKKLEWRGTSEAPVPVRERLSHALVHGITDFIVADTEEAYQEICVQGGARPLAVIDGPALTNLRTAAVSALATDRLAPPHARTLALFGAGAQARAHLAALAAVRPIENVVVISRTGPRADDLVRLATTQGLRARVGDPADVADADIVCCCTTATEPRFDGPLLRAGTHVVAVGAYRPDTRELDETTMTRGRVVVEDRSLALAEAGELAIPVAAGRHATPSPAPTGIAGRRVGSSSSPPSIGCR